MSKHKACPLRLQIHFPEEGFVTGVGAEGIVIRMKMEVKHQGIMLVDRLFEPVKSFVHLSET
jgi:hypothetical protein